MQINMTGQKENMKQNKKQKEQKKKQVSFLRK